MKIPPLQSTTPFAPLTAASAQLPSGSLVVQRTAPVRRSSAHQPPAVVLLPSFSVQGAGFCPEPVKRGGAIGVAQANSPRRWSKAQNMPLFCPAPTRPPPSRIGPCAKSQSGTCGRAQLSFGGTVKAPGTLSPQPTFRASYGRPRADQSILPQERSIATMALKWLAASRLVSICVDHSGAPVCLSTANTRAG